MYSKKLSASSNAGQGNVPQETDLDSAGERVAPPGESGSEGIASAPPSNTAPHNSNFTFQPLRWGLDSLYLSYPGRLSDAREYELKSLKKLAQGPSHEASSAQLEVHGHVFEVKDKSSGLFAYTLVDGSYMIRLSAGKSKKLPMAYVQISSRLLSHKVPMEIEAELREILRALGDVYAPKVSRVDVYLDFASDADMESWRRESWVTKAQNIAQYAEDSDFTGWTIGAGSTLSARLYQKVIESKKSGKEYIHDLWRQVGWDSVLPVWRMEFQFKREVLEQLQLDSLPSVLENLAGLWGYATDKWLRLCIANADDKTRSRWPVHPLWLAVSSIDWASAGGPLLRTYDAARVPSLDWLGSRCAALVASIASLANMHDFDAAWTEAKRHTYDAMATRNSISGISVEQYFAEKVQANSRDFNLRLNPKPKEKPVYQPERSEYERQSRG